MKTTHPIGFWAGYRIWLAERKRWWIVAVGLLLVAFVVALWASSAPHDPFAYDSFSG